MELIRSAQVETGALVRATYKGPAGLQSHVTYRLAGVEPGVRLSYVADPSHPLRGGGTGGNGGAGRAVRCIGLGRMTCHGGQRRWQRRRLRGCTSRGGSLPRWRANWGEWEEGKEYHSG